MMILLSAIAGVSASSLRAGRYVEHHVADVENIQRILTGLPARGALGSRQLSGETAGYRWRIDSKPFNADFLDPRAQAPWTPKMIVVTVQGPTGARLSFDMIKLVSAQTK
jgi:general secretion pathway protein I